MNIKRFKKAFTLVEIVIGLAVLGTVYTFSSASYNGYREMSQREQRKLDIQQVKNAVDNYHYANSKYPTAPINKQPSPDVKDSNGKIVSRGFSKVDVNMLVNQRYLQAAPKLEKNEFFAVDFNGIVSIETGASESLVIENGAVIVASKPGNLLDVEIFTAKGGASTIEIAETDKNYNGGTYKTFTATSNKDIENAHMYKGTIAVSEKPGQKYFKVKITYPDGNKAEAISSIQYALTSDNISSNPYWVGAGVTESNPVDINLSTESLNNNTAIKIDWTNQELHGGAMAVKYEIKKYINTSASGENLVETPDSPITTGNTQYIDKAIKGNTKYVYKVYAHTANKNEDGSNKKTLNALKYTTSQTGNFSDNISYINNITKNDFNASFSKTVAVRVGDIDGVKEVNLFIAQVEDGRINSKEKFKKYEMYKTKDGTSIVNSNNQKVETNVYSIPVEVKDDYMIYYIEVIDGRGNYIYNYYDSTLTQEPGESNKSFEARKEVVSPNSPGEQEDKCYTLMRGLVEIHNDSFVDDTKIDKENSKFQISDGKVTLP